jgi:hypothetical protein
MHKRVNRSLPARLLRFVRYRVLGLPVDPSSLHSEMLTPAIRELAVQEAARVARRFFADFYGEKREGQTEELDAIVADFFRVFDQRPIPRNAGGSGFENLFWLYVTGRLLEPDLVVEGGVWRGQTSWVLRQACPLAEFHAFDVDLSNRRYSDASIQYHEEDWSSHDFGDLAGRKTLAFFDDHVSQGRRIEEARERGLRTLIFDDNLPVYHIFQETDSIVPTVDMLFDDALSDGDEIEWIHANLPYRARVDLPAWRRTRSMVRSYANFPLVDKLASNFASKARYGGPSKIALVTLL